MMTKLALVAAGGAAGAMLRFLVGHWVTQAAPGLPLGTFFVNVIGSFAMGILAVSLMERPGAWVHFAPLLMPGLLGGFTTFSAFFVTTTTSSATSRWPRSLPATSMKSCGSFRRRQAKANHC